MIDILESDVGVIGVAALRVIDAALDPMVRIIIAAKAKNNLETADRMLPQGWIGIVLVTGDLTGWCVQRWPHPIDLAANRIATSRDRDNTLAVLSEPTTDNAVVIPCPSKTGHRDKNRQTNP